MTEEIYIITEEADERLDVFLVKKQPILSRSHIQKLIADGDVQINQQSKKANYRLRIGDQIALRMPEPKPVKIEAEAIALQVLYEDRDIIVIDKARGMVVHPAAGVYSGTLVNALLAHCHDLSGINGEIRPGIVHRLDKDTTGVMVAAKNDVAHLDLAAQIKEKSAQRQYLAIVRGNIKEDDGIIHGAIGRHPVDRKKMAVVFESGKPATTKFKILERFGTYTLVECTLLTGRTHQIRVHMAYIGHPLLGDPKYATQKDPFKISGQALHSKNLILVHPVTREKMFFSAPVPADMEKILRILRQGQKK